MVCASLARTAHAQPFYAPGSTGLLRVPPPAPTEPEASGGGPRRPLAGRLARAASIYGTAAALLSLSGAIAIAYVERPDSERITRGLWLGNVALGTPLVAFSAFMARRGSHFAGYRGLRRFGWAAYAAALSSGVLQWYGAFHDLHTPRALTITAGASGLLALAPHALDAFISGRHARSPRLSFHGAGATLRF